MFLAWANYQSPKLIPGYDLGVSMRQELVLTKTQCGLPKEGGKGELEDAHHPRVFAFKYRYSSRH